jgi:RNA polymerase sigma-70 factor, ECF subfamily
VSASELLDITALFNEHHEALYRYLSRLTGDADLAADAVQEAFVQLLRKPPEPRHIRGWLYKVGTNAALMSRRTSSRRQRILVGGDELVPMSDAPAAPDVAAERAQQRRIVHAALQKLPDRDRTILLMREEGFSHKEIAEAVGTTTGSVGTLISRAMDRLARELKLDEEERP